MVAAHWLAELQQGYQQLLEIAAVNNHRRWLLDVRRRQNTHHVGAQWMVSTFLPLLETQLSGRTRLAYLMAPIYLRDTAADAAFPAPAYFAGKPFIGARFVEENAAIAWLNE